MRCKILFSNTGDPLPIGFNYKGFISKGMKFGKTAGEGFGGWFIHEIIERMNGSLDIIDETGPEGIPDTDLATSFEINFPIIENQDE